MGERVFKRTTEWELRRGGKQLEARPVAMGLRGGRKPPSQNRKKRPPLCLGRFGCSSMGNLHPPGFSRSLPGLCGFSVWRTGHPPYLRISFPFWSSLVSGNSPGIPARDRCRLASLSPRCPARPTCAQSLGKARGKSQELGLTLRSNTSVSIAMGMSF